MLEPTWKTFAVDMYITAFFMLVINLAAGSMNGDGIGTVQGRAAVNIVFAAAVICFGLSQYLFRKRRDDDIKSGILLFFLLNCAGLFLLLMAFAFGISMLMRADGQLTITRGQELFITAAICITVSLAAYLVIMTRIGKGWYIRHQNRRDPAAAGAIGGAGGMAGYLAAKHGDAGQVVSLIAPDVLMIIMISVFALTLAAVTAAAVKCYYAFKYQLASEVRIRYVSRDFDEDSTDELGYYSETANEDAGEYHLTGLKDAALGTAAAGVVYLLVMIAFFCFTASSILYDTVKAGFVFASISAGLLVYAAMSCLEGLKHVRRYSTAFASARKLIIAAVVSAVCSFLIILIFLTRLQYYFYYLDAGMMAAVFSVIVAVMIILAARAVMMGCVDIADHNRNWDLGAVCRQSANLLTAAGGSYFAVTVMMIFGGETLRGALSMKLLFLAVTAACTAVHARSVVNIFDVRKHYHMKRYS
jgi:hypothetical protein